MEVDIGMIVETTTGIETETSLALEMKEMEEENTRSRTGQRDFDNTEFCNYCDIAGHTTHRCYKLTDYLNRNG